MASLTRRSRVIRPPKRLSRPLSPSAALPYRQDEPRALLDAFMGYVATFFHAPSRSRIGPLSKRRYPNVHVDVNAHVNAHAHAHAHAHQAHTHHIHAKRPSACGGSATSSAITQPCRRSFHDYFVTHLPSSSVHPDRSVASLHHKLPRAASTPHTPGPGSSPAAASPDMPTRDLTVVRIPLRSARHHFGVFSSRGSRVYNEDTSQAGTIDMPAFAKRVPTSFVRSQMSRSSGEGITADSSFGDPQIFYFAVFDGHGGTECSAFLRDELAGYIEDAAAQLGVESSLRRDFRGSGGSNGSNSNDNNNNNNKNNNLLKEQGEQDMKSARQTETETVPSKIDGGDPIDGPRKAVQLERELLAEYRNTVGGYFRRFNPAYFNLPRLKPQDQAIRPGGSSTDTGPAPATVEAVLTYAFLRADLDFVTAQARKPDPDDPRVADFPLNQDEVLGRPHLPPSGHGIGGAARFKGGSTASIALISTPTPAPYWHPAAHSTLLVAHVGDTRVLLCKTATGVALPLTSDHHPSSPSESRRLMRYASDSLVTDSFGEERIAGLANSRAFGDMQSKRIGVSAEPDITRVELGPAMYSFLVLMSDGVSGALSDQEIVDIVKEARTPDEGARHVVEYATEVSADGDNATCLVVRLGGWERRSEGGLGSLGTKEIRDIRRAEAADPRRGIR